MTDYRAEFQQELMTRVAMGGGTLQQAVALMGAFSDLSPIDFPDELFGTDWIRCSWFGDKRAMLFGSMMNPRRTAALLLIGCVPTGPRTLINYEFEYFYEGNSVEKLRPAQIDALQRVLLRVLHQLTRETGGTDGVTDALLAIYVEAEVYAHPKSGLAIVEHLARLPRRDAMLAASQRTDDHDHEP